VTEGADQNKHLVAFCSGDRPSNPGVLRPARQELPTYMVPSASIGGKRCHYGEREDRPEGTLGACHNECRAPSVECRGIPAHSTPDTRHSRIATRSRAPRPSAGCNRMERSTRHPRDQIGRGSLFELGGTSLSALKLAIALDRAVSLKDSTITRFLPIWPRWLTTGSAQRRQAAAERLPHLEQNTERKSICRPHPPPQRLTWTCNRHAADAAG